MERQNRRRESRAERVRRVKRNRRILALALVAAVVLAGLILRGVLPGRNAAGGPENAAAAGDGAEDPGRPPLDVQLLTPNPFSRPQTALEQINGIVVHYTANPGTSAQANRDYFEGLKDGSTGTYASSHFVIGLDGEIIQCIPSTEISYASNDRNYDTLSIECCHPDDSGQFTEATYRSLVDLTAWLCSHFQVPQDGVIRHYDVTGKDCPKYFVENEAAWEQFHQDVSSRIAELQSMAGEEQQ